MEVNQIIIEAFANINEQLTANEMYLNGDEEFYNLKEEMIAREILNCIQGEKK